MRKPANNAIVADNWEQNRQACRYRILNMGDHSRFFVIAGILELRDKSCLERRAASCSAIDRYLHEGSSGALVDELAELAELAELVS